MMTEIHIYIDFFESILGRGFFKLKCIYGKSVIWVEPNGEDYISWHADLKPDKEWKNSTQNKKKVADFLIEATFPFRNIILNIYEIFSGARSEILLLLVVKKEMNVKQISSLIEKTYSTTYGHIEQLKKLGIIDVYNRMGPEGNTIKLKPNIFIHPQSEYFKEKLENWENYKKEFKSFLLGYESVENDILEHISKDLPFKSYKREPLK